jgi:hypothetical protein
VADDPVAWSQASGHYSATVPDEPASDDDSRQAASALGSFLVGSLDPGDVEAQIGALVLDTCLETQQELYGRPRNRAVDQALAAAVQEALDRAARDHAVPDDVPESRESAGRYDVVEPVDGAPSDFVPDPEPRKYRRLFTELRRRTQSTT